MTRGRQRWSDRVSGGRDGNVGGRAVDVEEGGSVLGLRAQAGSSEGEGRAGSPCVLGLGQGKEPDKEARFGPSVLSIIRICVTSFP